ncbi:MAG TPA: N-acetyltransferase [Planctomycetes bacterium]|nr:N-acetyltransferase [Planctomycetota bacterium]
MSETETAQEPFPKRVAFESCRFEGGNFVLRPFSPVRDGSRLFEAVQASLPDLSPFLPWAVPDYSLETAREFVEDVPQLWDQGNAFHFGIFSKEDGRCLGGVGLNMVSRAYRILNLGYWVASAEKGTGLATQSARLLVEFAFRELGALRVEVLAAVTNRASRRVAEKLGAQFEGVLRNRLLVHGRPQDGAMASLIPQDLDPS